MSLFQDMISKLTDLFVKNEDSNIGKIIRLISDELEQVQTALETTEEWRDIDKAEGTTLDLIGENVGQPRDNVADEEFRLLIKTKIFSNLSAGDIDSVNQILRIYLGNNFVSVQEGWQLEGTPFDGEDAMLFITVKGDNNLLGIPFEHTSRIVAKGVGTTWDYVFERSLVSQRSYNRWVFPYEKFTGQLVAGTEETISNKNALYKVPLEISRQYIKTTNDFLISSQEAVIGSNESKVYQAGVNTSGAYAATFNDYMVCGGLEENTTETYQAEMQCQRGYLAFFQSYPMCGETFAERT